MTEQLKDQRGFALIELMVALVILGILVGVAIPAFLNQREKSQDACAKSQLHTMQTAMEIVFTNQQSYSSVNLTTLRSDEPSIVESGACGDGTVAVVGGLVGDSCDPAVGPGSTDYCLSQTSASGRSFVMALAPGGAVVRSCAPVGVGCESGRW